MVSKWKENDYEKRNEHTPMLLLGIFSLFARVWNDVAEEISEIQITQT